MSGVENEYGVMCWCTTDANCLSGLVTVRNAVRNIAPSTSASLVPRNDALAEFVRRVLTLRGAGTYAQSGRTFATLADTVLRSFRHKVYAEDASEALLTVLQEKGGVFSEIVFPQLAYTEQLVYLCGHGSHCPNLQSGQSGLWKHVITCDPVFMVSKCSLAIAWEQYNAASPSCICAYEHGTYFADAVTTVDDSDDIPKPSLLVRCLNAVINPPATELGLPDYAYSRKVSTCKYCRLTLPKDACVLCSERIHTSTVKRFVQQARHRGQAVRQLPPPVIVVHVERLESHADMAIDAPDAIELRNFGMSSTALSGYASPRGIVVDDAAASQSHTYILKSVAHRRGGVRYEDSLAERGGHWWANLRIDKEWWLECDDARVSAMRSKGNPRNATMFFYEHSTVVEDADDSHR